MKKIIYINLLLFLFSFNFSYSQLEPGKYVMQDDNVYIEAWLSGSQYEAFNVDSLYYFKSNQLIFVGHGEWYQEGEGFSGAGYYEVRNKKNLKDNTIIMTIHLIYGKDKLRIKFKNEEELEVKYKITE